MSWERVCVSALLTSDIQSAVFVTYWLSYPCLELSSVAFYESPWPGACGCLAKRHILGKRSVRLVDE